MPSYLVGVDIGGTFVDAIKLDTQTGQFELKKSSTTPSEPWIGVLKVMKQSQNLSEAFQNCYLNTNKTKSHFINLINVEDGDCWQKA